MLISSSSKDIFFFLFVAWHIKRQPISEWKHSKRFFQRFFYMFTWMINSFPLFTLTRNETIEIHRTWLMTVNWSVEQIVSNHFRSLANDNWRQRGRFFSVANLFRTKCVKQCDTLNVVVSMGCINQPKWEYSLRDEKRKENTYLITMNVANKIIPFHKNLFHFHISI